MPPMSARTVATEARYQEAKKQGNLTPLEDCEAIINYRRWKLINNDFPYDDLFSKHEMIVPKRHFSHWYQMRPAEIWELLKILKFYYDTGYCDLFILNTPKKQSYKSLFHMHIATYYKNRGGRVGIEAE
jgi:diadenosine tetraphosphate (Ap4A) HIT family hydrolase